MICTSPVSEAVMPAVEIVSQFLRRCAGLVFVTVLVTFVAACANSSTVEQVTHPDELKPLAFLNAGPASRRDIEARFGVPWSVYEDGRIVIYHFDGLDEPLRRAQRSGNLHLVIVYASDDNVERWSLVHMDRQK